TAAPGHRLDGVHVDAVDVRAFLPVDLDRDEALVQQPRRRFVLEGFALHHVTPVAGRVAHGEEHRPVVRTGPIERLLAPRVPVDRVVGVLEQVRARRTGESIGPTRSHPSRLSHVVQNRSRGADAFTGWPSASASPWSTIPPAWSPRSAGACGSACWARSGHTIARTGSVRSTSSSSTSTGTTTAGSRPSSTCARRSQTSA